MGQAEIGGSVDAVLSSGWDSVRQRALLGAYGTDGVPQERATAESRVELLGRLRWEVIQGGVVFLTYTQLLDGAAFAVLRPAELLDELAIRAVGGGAMLPVRVNARDADLGAQLLAMLSRGFLLSSLPLSGERCHRLQHRLAEAGGGVAASGADGPVDAVDRLLRASGELDPALRLRLVARWRDWLEAAGRGLLEVRDLAPADYPTAYAVQPPPAPGELRSDAGRGVLEAWTGRALDVGGMPNRSLLYDRLEPLTRAAGRAERDDAELLRESFDETYYRAIAAGERCMLALAAPRRGVRRREAEALTGEAPLVTFPTGFERRLGLMPGEDWQRFADDAADALGRWWEARDPAALQEIGELLGGRTKDPGSGGPAAGGAPMTRIQRAVRTVGGRTGELTAAGGLGAAANLVAGEGLLGDAVSGMAGTMVPVVVAVVLAGGRAVGRRSLDAYRGRCDVVELPTAVPTVQSDPDGQ
ncbi:hypothetical protein GCM10010446_27410 [Streptomyces enissocaesilis]|uniref:Uncharacterized protein n=1 Tax=Streptomyces enissocaesilis TaxID=332589 RepID=A0ABN3X803_9ACTN